MAVSAPSIAQICRNAQFAARDLAQQTTAAKNAALGSIADALVARTDEILAANEQDLANGREAELSAALLDRLALTVDRVKAMADGIRTVIELDDPVGETLEEFTVASGLKMRKVRVPLGVVAVVYEARPNVTIDAAALAIKSGNAIVLRGSSSASFSNAVLVEIVRSSLESSEFPVDSVVLVATTDRGDLRELATQSDSVDLIIPRGGEGLKRALQAVATVPVIYAASGNCHVFVDESADFEMAQQIVLNAKTQRPGVCNAAESLLIHHTIAEPFLARIIPSLRAAGVEIRADERTREFAGSLASELVEATEEDFAEEFLACVIAVKVVDDLAAAIDHINKYSSGHSEAIVTSNHQAGETFQQRVNSACVYVNASTRFTDGAEFGMGAEIGNSTQKLHVRGPIGLRELCTYKYLGTGTGQVRT